MRPTGTAAEREKRRLLAIQRLNEGYTAQEIADFLGVQLRTVRRWIASYRKRGIKGLRAKTAARPRKLTPRQERTVLTWFLKSSRAATVSPRLAPATAPRLPASTPAPAPPAPF